MPAQPEARRVAVRAEAESGSGPSQTPCRPQAAGAARVHPPNAPPATPARRRRSIDGVELTYFRAVVAACTVVIGISDMIRMLVLSALCAFCIVPNAASAVQTSTQHGRLSDFSSRQRCACSTSLEAVRTLRIRHYHRIRAAYLIGYDPLPYRYGSTFVFEPPYHYYRR